MLVLSQAHRMQGLMADAPRPHFTKAGMNKMTEARVNECHRAVKRFVVKGERCPRFSVD